MNEYLYGLKKRSSFDGVYEMTLLEGLTASYGSKKLISELKKIFGDSTSIEQFPLDIQKRFAHPKYGIVSSVIVQIKSISTSQLERLTKVVAYFGYYISNTKTNGPTTTIQIEPRFAVNIYEYMVEQNITEAYHITPKSNLEKIKRFGLAPRGTETTFYHPDDRIYLICADHSALKSFKRILAKDKQLDESDLVVLSTPIDEHYEYYIDDTTYRPKDEIAGEVLACFVLKNIPPNKLTTVKI